MLDTVKLILTDMDIKNSSECMLTIQPASYKPSDLEAINNHKLFRYSQTDLFEEGSKAFYNNDKINVTVKPVPSGGSLCIVQFSVPKQKHSNNYNTLNYSETKEAFKSVEKNLKEIGINTNIKNSLLSRVDTAKTIITEESFQDYKKVFELLSVKRMNKRDYGTTYLFENNQQEICIYDKFEEMFNKKIECIIPKNSMRLEHRMLKSQKVKSCLGFNNVNDLLQSELNFKELNNNFNKSISNYIFKHDLEEIQLLTSNQLQKEMEYYFSFTENKRNWFEQYLKYKGCQSIIEVSGIEALKEAMKKFLDSIEMTKEARRQKVHRFEKEINEAVRFLKFHEKIDTEKSKTILNLYNELKIKSVA